VALATDDSAQQQSIASVIVRDQYAQAFSNDGHRSAYFEEFGKVGDRQDGFHVVIAIDQAYVGILTARMTT
jgi:hypothetical protein